jgi:hypothetical protein
VEEEEEEEEEKGEEDEKEEKEKEKKEEEEKEEVEKKEDNKKVGKGRGREEVFKGGGGSYLEVVDGYCVMKRRDNYRG